jgi:2-hydroxycyclohexanecarboxyl-CoA dehydrogenase
VTSASRTAVLTGAASPRGIGRVCARRLAQLGWAIAVLDIDGDGASRAAADIAREFSVPALGIHTDVTSEESVDRALTAVQESLPPVGALVNLAGISSPTAFVDTTLEEWERVFAVNSRGVFLVSRRVLPAMIERGWGRIVNVSSISAQRGGGTYSKVAYSASKAAILGFTRSLAREVGRSGITVNAVAPGPVDTDIMGGTLDEDQRATFAEGTMTGRIGTPEDVAATICFLVGDDAGNITAATLDVNGGLQVS